MSSVWAVVAAAGIGSRMNSSTPKQYLSLDGQTIMEYTLTTLLQVADISGIVVGLAEEDTHWHKVSIGNNKVFRVTGGAQRSDTVFAGLRYLSHRIATDDWVLVHDAVRPCITPQAMRAFITRIRSHPIGGIMAVAVNDTLKSANAEDNITATIDRQGMWCAQTPQMFRYGLLYNALNRARQEGQTLSDESMAMEYAGYQPLIVPGCADNIKITTEDDIALASAILNEHAHRSRV